MKGKPEKRQGGRQRTPEFYAALPKKKRPCRKERRGSTSIKVALMPPAHRRYLRLRALSLALARIGKHPDEQHPGRADRDAAAAYGYLCRRYERLARAAGLDLEAEHQGYLAELHRRQGRAPAPKPCTRNMHRTAVVERQTGI